MLCSFLFDLQYFFCVFVHLFLFVLLYFFVLFLVLFILSYVVIFFIFYFVFYSLIVPLSLFPLLCGFALIFICFVVVLYVACIWSSFRLHLQQLLYLYNLLLKKQFDEEVFNNYNQLQPLNYTLCPYHFLYYTHVT